MLRITVSGPVRSGKSTIARALSDYLLKLGFEVALDDDPSVENFLVRDISATQRQLATLRKRGLSIKVSTQQTRREAA